jgi:hypothetical protein
VADRVAVRVGVEVRVGVSVRVRVGVRVGNGVLVDVRVRVGGAATAKLQNASMEARPNALARSRKTSVPNGGATVA